MTTPLDPRRHVYRADLAAEHLRGTVAAERYVSGERRQVAASALPLRRAPRFDATLDTEALHGETLTVYDEDEGWAWVQLDHDGYVGYMPSEGLITPTHSPTHRVSALRTYIFPEPDSKVPPLAILSLNARVAVTETSGRYVPLANGGFIYASHVTPLGETADDFVAVAMAIGAYAKELAEDRRERPGDDLTTSLVEAELDGEQLTSAEVASFFILLVVAGNETTRNAIRAHAIWSRPA